MSEERRLLGEPMVVRFNNDQELHNFEDWAFSSDMTDAEKELQRELDEFRVKQQVTEKLWDLRLRGRTENKPVKLKIEVNGSRAVAIVRGTDVGWVGRASDGKCITVGSALKHHKRDKDKSKVVATKKQTTKR